MQRLRNFRTHSKTKSGRREFRSRRPLFYFDWLKRFHRAFNLSAIYFYSHEPNEPPHIHVDRDDSSAKFWLQPVSLARNRGFAARELRQVQETVTQHQAEFSEAWNEYFDGDNG